jgi:hypothetical protein
VMIRHYYELKIESRMQDNFILMRNLCPLGWSDE